MAFATQRAALYINVRDLGAVGDGVHDDTVAITAAITSAHTSGGGTVFFPAGTYITTGQTLYDYVLIRGAGRNCSIIKLKNSTNTDLFSAVTSLIDLTASFGSDLTNGGIRQWGFQDITLDGNRANQSSGPSWCVRVYGYDFMITNVCMIDAFSGCWQNDWRGNVGDTATDNKPAQIHNLECYNSGGTGLQFGGPHDTVMSHVFSGFHDVHCMHLCPNAGGMQITMCHLWSSQNNGPITGGGIPLLMECSFSYLDNMEIEGGHNPFPQVAFLGDHCCFVGADVFSDSTLLGSGIQIGQQGGNTPYQGQINQTTRGGVNVGGSTTTYVSSFANYLTGFMHDCAGTNGGLWLANDGGNTMEFQAIQTAGSYVTGTLASNSTLVLNGQGLTPNGTTAKEGVFQISSALSLLSSGTAAATATSGTINTTGVNIARVAPTGNITSVILQAGIYEGQEVVVRNESTHTITFHTTPATSHIADAATPYVIAANRSARFSWNKTNSLWY